MDAITNFTSDNRKTTVMVVEDEVLLLMLYEDAIEEAGARAVSADSLSDGLAALDLSIDVAILDIRLGDEKVFPLAYKLLEIGIPFLFCSGTADDMPKGAFSDVPLMNKPVKAQVVVERALTLIRRTTPCKS